MKYGFTFLFISVTFSNKGCDLSKRFSGVTEYFPLTSCHRDIRAHLRAVNASQTSILTEKDLILARSGHFEEEGLNIAVCPNLGSLSFTMRSQVGTQGNKSCRSLSVTTLKTT